MSGVYLHECDEQEEGVGRPPDLLIEEPGQEGENPIFGGTAGEDKKKGDLHFVYITTAAGRASECISVSLTSCINCELMISVPDIRSNSITSEAEREITLFGFYYRNKKIY